MKRILLVVFIILTLCIGLIYWSTSSTEEVFDTCSLVDGSDINAIDFHKHDSVLLIPNSMYEGDDIKNIIQGQQYRKAWSTPVKYPILFLDTLYGGVKVIDEGGGKQTHSLDLLDKQGIVYSLRSINKDPKVLIPEAAKLLNLENIVVDGISAQHPYGAVLAAKLADAASILHTKPQAFFVPKQKSLGNYNEKYGNRLFLLEYETEGKTNWTSFENVLEIMDTDDLQKLKQKHGNKVSINKEAFIKTRLFDIIIGDWDRHGKQWGWIIIQQNENFLAHPLAGDRDNAFFNIDGLLPLLISNRYITPKLRPFESDIDFFPGLVYPIDRYFLLNTEEALFVDQAQNLQKQISDSVIDNAFKVWPNAIAELDKKAIAAKIKSRRDHLVEYAETFKKVIDDLGILNEPIVGSEDEDFPERLKNCFDCDTLTK